MSLRAKYALITLVLGLVLSALIVIFVWSIETLHREVTVPFRSTTSVLSELRELKRQFEEQGGFLLGETPTTPGRYGMRAPSVPPAHPVTDADRAAVQQYAREIDARLDAVLGNEWSEARIGPGSGRNLASRTEMAQSLVRRWIETGEENARLDAARSLFELHEIIERLEGRLLVEADLAYEHGAWVRGRMYIVSVGAGLLVLSVLTLRIALDQRWVLAPIAGLHQAARVIGTGDFSHRVETRGNDEITDLGREMNRMAHTVQQMQEERVARERLAAVGAMVRRVAHNLRNPLAGIRGLSELMRREQPPGSRLFQKHDRIIETVDGCERWLRELLDVTSPLSITPRSIRLGPWAQGVVTPYRSSAEAREVELAVDSEGAPSQADFDPGHLEHALGAIIANAIEVSPRGSVVTIRIDAVDDGWWSIEVSDQGPGVPNELQTEVFRPYFTTKADGSGIGLAVAKRVIVSHGGEIGIDSGPPSDDGGTAGPTSGDGRGTTVRVRLPVIAVVHRNEGL